MVKIQIAPISVNQCYTGRRFKTEKYKAFEKELTLKLPGGKIYDAEKLKIIYTFGISNKNMDLGNLEKCTTDILQIKYGFNDNRIYEIHSFKKIVPKNQEYIEVNIIPISE